MTGASPHKLDLYRLAVQQPAATAHFMIDAYARLHRGAWPTRLKEDFAGTAAIAMQWVALEADHEAIAVDHHGPTVRFARRRAKRVLGPDGDRLQLIEADVCDVMEPKADIVCALNFSVLTWHDKRSLVRYFRCARRSLRPGGIVVVDVYGGPGAERCGVQTRRVIPERREHVPPFEYQWEQRSFDPRARRTDCRIHFKISGRLRRDAFCYDWRLWHPRELADAMRAAGFKRARVGRRAGTSENWLAYVIGC